MMVNNLTAIKLLLSNPKNFNSRDVLGQKVLHHAIKQANCEETLALLLRPSN
ncbi:MAG: hypothetical protein H0V82_08040 [Candidatus Protochlamydia sp.]|nr:hypothetical protein [Candidatus Protochlamydia sp.]